MVELVVLITGLCGYVPQYDAAGKLTSFDVYLVDASHPDGVAEHDEEAENHVAGIVVHRKYVDFGNTCRPGEELDASGYWFFPIALTGEHLSIDPAGSGLTLFDEAGDERQCPQSAADTLSYRWVPPMSEIVPNRRLRDLTGLLGDRSAKLVTGAVRFTGGEVMSGGLIPNKNGKIALWRFSNGLFHKHTQAVAETVAVFRNLEDAESVKICFDADEAGGCNQGYVKLKAVDASAGKEIVFWVKNQPQADLVPGDRDHYPKVDEHFPHLYRFLLGTQARGEPRRLDEQGSECDVPRFGERNGQLEENLRPGALKILQIRRDFSPSPQLLDEVPFSMVNNPQCPGADYDYL